MGHGPKPVKDVFNPLAFAPTTVITSKPIKLSECTPTQDMFYDTMITSLTTCYVS